MKRPRAVTSLDKPIGTEGNGILGDLVARHEETSEDEIVVRLHEEMLRRAVARLPEPERQVIELRFGFDRDEPSSLAETGRQLGLRPERVRALEKRALEQLAVNREIDSLREAA